MGPMPELERLEARTLPSVAPSQPLAAILAFNEALDLYELAGGGKALRQNVQSAADRAAGLGHAIAGALEPAQSALLWAFLGNYVSTPQPILVNPGSQSPVNGQPVYYVNGVGNTQDDAVLEAKALANQLHRPVALIYNPTHGLFDDVLRTTADLLWQPPQPQPDPATRELAGVMLSAWQKGQTVDVVGYSEGAVLVNNALLTMDDLGLGSWAFTHVAVLSVAAPLGSLPADGTAHFQRIDNAGDPIVELFGDRQFSLLGKIDLLFLGRDSINLHYFLSGYLGQLSTASLF